MGSPAGKCEWCGGPQNWTIVRGEMYVLCQAGCLGLFDEGPGDPLPDSEWPRGMDYQGAMEHPSEGGVPPLEGGATDESVCTSTEDISKPPAGWLSSLWHGGPDGA